MELYNLIILVLKMYHHRKHLLRHPHLCVNARVTVAHFFTALVGRQPLQP